MNVLKLVEEIFPNSLRIFDDNVKKHMLLLITISSQNLSRNSTHTVTAVLEENPKITCDIKFNKVNRNSLRAEICFSEQLSKQQYTVTLYYINSQCKVDLSDTIEVSLMSHKCQHFFQTEYKVLDSKASRYGYHHNPLPDKLINDNLHILCKIEIKNSSSVKVDVPKSELNAKFVFICGERLLTDFKIICQYQEFLVHKVVLAYSSPVFQKLLETPMKEAKTNQIAINNFQPNVVELMINYMYSDSEIQEDLSQETLNELFQAAHMYQLEGLAKFCLKKMCKKAKDISEVVELIAFAGSEYKEEMVQFLKDVRYTILLSE